MNLYTRCPGCETVFRVTTRDLQASGGRVRCGHCQSVFDAFATLSAQEPAAGESAPMLVDGPPASAASGPSEDAQAEAVAPAGQPVPAQKPAPAAQSLPADRPASVALREDDPAAALYEWEFRMPPARPRTALWVGLSLLLLVCAVAQAAVALRTEMQVAYPQTRAVYVRICAYLGCEIGLPQLGEHIHIEASDLQFVDPAQPAAIELAILVRNRAPIAVAYPAFELTLTNLNEQVVARRVFMPREYLEDPAGIADGLGPRAELPIRLYLETGNVRAAGYRVYFFYP